VNSDPPDSGDFILYATDDGEAKLQVRMADETVWLSIDQMAELFQRNRTVINRHINNIFKEGELDEKAVSAKFALTAADGKSYQVAHYNLDVIISVGYRVKSLRGTQFRIWATRQLREYIVKGFVLNDDRFKNSADNDYFEELLGRIRDIRASEKIFYKKLLDLFATSIDYDKSAPQTQRIFALIQNKLHWAAHGHTAAEVVHDRANAAKPNMGLTSWSGQQVRKRDIEIAKNSLNDEELDTRTAWLMPILILPNYRPKLANLSTWEIGNPNSIICSPYRVTTSFSIRGKSPGLRQMRKLTWNMRFSIVSGSMHPARSNGILRQPATK